MPTQLKSRCPHCQVAVKVSESHVGQRVRCPACKQSFEVASVEVSLPSAATLKRSAAASETMEYVASDTRSTAGDPNPAKTAAKQSAEQSAKLGKLGRFELQELLGQGAFGRVYRAYDPQLDRFVALKVPTFGPQDTQKIQRFIAEAKAAAKLRHPNIVPTYESGQVDGQYYIAAQFVAGQPLANRIKEQTPDFRQSADWVRQLADALAYAHKEGIVHRDIKPDNIMLDEHAVPQIMDFGLAKRVNEDAGMTTDGSILGTPAYMAPEQARGDHKQVGPASDQYSLGVVLYQLLTGDKPFSGPPHAVIAQVISSEPPSPRSIRDEIPRDLESICQKAMSKEIGTRYTGSTELAGDLARWLAFEPVSARPMQAWERFGRWSRRNPTIAALSGGLLAVALLAFIAVSAAFAWAMSSYYQAIADRNTARQAREHSDILAETIRQDRDKLQSTLQALQTQTTRADAQTEQVGRLDLRLKDLNKEIAAAEAIVGKAKEAEQAAGQRAAAAEQSSQAALAKVAAETARAQRLLGQSYLDLGMRKIVDGSVHEGALWLARGLEAIPADADDLATTIRGNLSRYLAADDESARRSPRVRLALAHEQPISAAAAHPQESWLVTGNSSGGIHLWDTAKGTAIASDTAGTKPILSVLFNPADRSMFAALSSDARNLPLWRISKAGALERLSELRLGAPFTSAAWSQDGRWILTGSDQTRSLQIVNSGTRKLDRFGEEVMKGRVYSVAFPPAGEGRTAREVWAAVGTGLLEKAVWKWDILEHKVLGAPLALSGDVRVLAFDPTGKTLAACTQDKRIFFIDVTSWKLSSGNPIVCESPVTAAAFGPDGRTLLVGFEDRTARLYDYQERKPLGDVLRHGGPVNAVGFAATGNEFFTVGEDKNVRMWTMPQRSQSVTIDPDKPVIAIALSPDGSHLVLAVDRDLEVWNARSGQRVKQISDKVDPIFCLAFDPNGQTLLVGDAKGARLWDAYAWKPIGPALVHDGERVLAVAYSRDGRMVATAGANFQAKVWRVDTQASVGQPVRLPDRLTSVALSPDGTLLATGCADHQVRIWQVADSAKPLHVLAAKSLVHSVAFSDDGKFVAAGCDYGEALAWDAASGAAVGAPLPHSGTVRQVTFLPRTPFLATASRGGVNVWSVLTQKEIGAAKSTGGQAIGLAVDRAGATFAALSENDKATRIHIWTNPPMLQGSPAQVSAWVRVATNLQLSESGVVSPVSAAELEAARKRLAAEPLTASP